MRMILNELSLCSRCETIEDGHKVMQEFLENYTEMDRLLTDKGIILMNSFHNIMLTDDYSIHNWTADKRIEKRLKDKFRSLRNRSQYVNEEEYCNSEFKVMEFNQEINAIGCQIAYEREDVVISMRTHELWDECIIKGLYFSLSDNFKYHKQITVSVPNVSQQPHVLSYRQSAIQDTCLLISSGQDLWEKKDILYPHLVFCESVKDQLLMDTEKIHIEQIMNRLLKMEEYFATYDGVFDCKLLGLRARQESESVINSDYGKQRIFRTPYGDDRTFYWHINFAGKFPGRIHFLPEEKSRKCLIGYIGKHLPTPTYRTI